MNSSLLSPQLHRGTSGTTSGGSRRGERVSDPGSLAALAPVQHGSRAGLEGVTTAGSKPAPSIGVTRCESCKAPEPANTSGAGEAPIVRAFCCGQEVRVHGITERLVRMSVGRREIETYLPIGSVSYCVICGRKGPFALRILHPGQTRFVGV